MGTGLLVVNYDADLAEALEDAWSLQSLGVDLPEAAHGAFAQRHEFRLHAAKLELVATQYNRVVDSVTATERPLVLRALQDVHSLLEAGLTELTWTSPGVGMFVEAVSKAVARLHGNLMHVKGNLGVMLKILRTWRAMHKVVRFSEKESWEARKKLILHNLTEVWQGETPGIGGSKQEKNAKKWLRRWRSKVSLRLNSLDDVRNQHNRILRLLESSREILVVDRRSDAWSAYLAHVNSLFVSGFVAAVKESLGALLKYLEVARTLDAYGRPPEGSRLRMPRPLERSHLLAVRLLLHDGEAVFDPSARRDDYGSVQYRVYEWCNALFEVGRQLRRIDEPANNYYILLFEHPELNSVKGEILQLMISTVQKLEAVRMDFLKYSYIWQDEPDVFVERFALGLIGDGSGGTSKVDPEPFEDFDKEDERDEDVYADAANLRIGQLTAPADAPPEAAAPRRRATIAEFEAQIKKFETLAAEIEALPADVSYGWLSLDTTPLKAELARLAREWRQKLLNYQRDRLLSNTTRFKEFVSVVDKGVSIRSAGDVSTYASLVSVMKHLAMFQRSRGDFDRMHESAKSAVVLLRKNDIHLPAALVQDVDDAPVHWRDLRNSCSAANAMLADRQEEEIGKIRAAEAALDHRAAVFHGEKFQRDVPATMAFDPRAAYARISLLHVRVAELEERLHGLQRKQKLFQLLPSTGRSIRTMRIDLRLLKYLWDAAALSLYQMDAWNHVPCTRACTSEMEQKVESLVAMISGLDMRVRRWPVYHDLLAKAHNFLISLPLLQSLKTPAMKQSHWQELMACAGARFDANDLSVENILSLNLHRHPEAVAAIVDQAIKQLHIEETLRSIAATWDTLSLDFTSTCDPPDDYPVFSVPDVVEHTTQEHQLLLQNLSRCPNVGPYCAEIQQWQRRLASVEAVLGIFAEVQATCRHLRPIFASDVRMTLPEPAQAFAHIDDTVRAMLRRCAATSRVLDLCQEDSQELALIRLQAELHRCENALQGYIDGKRKVFPRFYFVSNALLLEILSRPEGDPQAVAVHVARIMQEVASLTLDGVAAVAVTGRDGEIFTISQPADCTGRAEVWLQACVDSVAATISFAVEHALQAYNTIHTGSRLSWLKQHITQVALVASSIHWAADVSSTFHALQEGNEAALKEQYRRCHEHLSDLIEMIVAGGMPDVLRRRVTNLVTQSAHHVEVIAELIKKKTDSKNAFVWQKQLRHRLDEARKGVVAEICDCRFAYGGEYQGDAPRLIVTPLTERLYITLAQSVWLKMGGAPSGPAGTGKTETIRDLSKHLARACYLFNCSEQMTSDSLAQVFKGLASAGGWGCFEDINRMRPAVLSVVSVHFKQLFDAKRAHRAEVRLQNDAVNLDESCSVFATLNREYAGRFELPHNVKLLFRPVHIVSPDSRVIAETTLLADGFEDAKRLSGKLCAFFSLGKDLASSRGQYHWGLRALKTLLTAAGAARRCAGAAGAAGERRLLAHALRDFGGPRVHPDDADVVLALVRDLFPEQAVAAQRRPDDFCNGVRAACAALGAQPEEGLLAKCHQLHEILGQTHCCLIIGDPAAGKTTCRNVLLEWYRAGGRRCVDKVINPKAVPTCELFGCIDGVTGEWRDGLASSIIRGLAQASAAADHSWVVFDGDLDTGWAESMNTAMDDNKVLTLVSNDRIPLPLNMKLLFEVSTVRFATPATVTRTGALYLSTTDIGWLPYLQSYFDKKQMVSTVTPLVDKYVQRCLNFVTREAKTAIPHTEYTLVRQLCVCVDVLLHRGEGEVWSSHTDKEAEHYFAFACIWAFGGALPAEDGHRTRFDRWWRAEWKALKFPDAGTVFDYRISRDTRKLEKWSEGLTRAPSGEGLAYVATGQTHVVQYFFDRVLATGKPILLTGPDGSGKTLFVQSRMDQLSESARSQTVCFNYNTTPCNLKARLVSRLERKMGRKWGPVGSGQRKLIWVLDDVNTPMVDEYGTQPALELLRQNLDYGMWYDQAPRWVPVETSGVQMVAVMNPSMGSFTVNQRFQRHFVCLQMPAPSRDCMRDVYTAVLSAGGAFDPPSLAKDLECILEATLDVHQSLKKGFQRQPSEARKSSVNMRHLARVFEGLVLGLKSVKLAGKQGPGNGGKQKEQHSPKGQRGGVRQAELLCLWSHEMRSAFSDGPNEAVAQVIQTTARRHFEPAPELDAAIAAPPVYSAVHPQPGAGPRAPFSTARYAPIASLPAWTAAAAGHTDPPVVLFERAAVGVVRVARLLLRPRGHVCLFGAEGTGKRTAARLAASLCGMACSERAGGGGFRKWLLPLYVQSAAKGTRTVLLLTEKQLAEGEDVLSDVSSLLATGDVTHLLSDDQGAQVVRSMKPEARRLMIVDSPENCWALFVEAAVKAVRVVLTYSSAAAHQTHVLRFPAISSYAALTSVLPWDRAAYVAIGLARIPDSLLAGYDREPSNQATPQQSFTAPGKRKAGKANSKPTAAQAGPALKTRVVAALAEIHASYLKAAAAPAAGRDFLELVCAFCSLLDDRAAALAREKSALEAASNTVSAARAQAEQLGRVFADKRETAGQRKAHADELAHRLQQETAFAAAEHAKAAAEEEKAAEMQRLVTEKAAEMDADLAAAEPLLHAAQAALDSVGKTSLAELRAVKTPPIEVQNVLSAILVLLSAPQGKLRDKSWPAAQKCLQRPDVFLQSLASFKKDAVSDSHLAQLKPYLADPSFTPEFLQTRSPAAAALCEWVCSVVKYNDAHRSVQPKQDLVQEGILRHDEATQRAAKLRQHVERLQGKLAELGRAAAKAREECETVATDAGETGERLEWSRRVAVAMAEEQAKWAANIGALEENRACLVGAAVLAAAAACYLGSFGAAERRRLLAGEWRGIVQKHRLPHTADGLDPVNTLSTPAQRAGWFNNHLPREDTAVQNACILEWSRVPVVLIDPHFQALGWIHSSMSAGAPPTPHAQMLQPSSDTMWAQAGAAEEGDPNTKRASIAVPAAGPAARSWVVARNTDDLDRVLAEGVSRGETVVVEKVAAPLHPALAAVVRHGCWSVDAPAGQKRRFSRFTWYPMRRSPLGNWYRHENGMSRLFLVHTRSTTSARRSSEDQPELRGLRVVDFNVTPEGLEEQLLSLVVSRAAADVERKKQDILFCQYQ
ncbi:Dynein beta chain [Diplonema papillatum]|nr:Dynein beta chain [Diplonema papillatum]